MKIIVDRMLCDGNGYCAKEAPELLSLDNRDTVHVLKESFGEESADHARAAVRVCPKQALKVLEDN